MIVPTPEEEVLGIHFVDLDGSDLGVPAPGVYFDTDRPTASLTALGRWTGILLRARSRAPNGFYPVLPVEIRGRGKDTMVRSLCANLPPGVTVYLNGGRQVFRSIRDGSPAGPGFFYLIAR